MGDRSISISYRRWLTAELQRWQAAGVISSQQADQILSQYQDDAEASQRTLSRASWVLQAISAILVFLALLLLIGYNWSAMSDVAKLLVIFVVVIGTYATAFYLRFSRKAAVGIRNRLLLWRAHLWSRHFSDRSDLPYQRPFPRWISLVGDRHCPLGDWHAPEFAASAFGVATDCLERK